MFLNQGTYVPCTIIHNVKNVIYLSSSIASNASINSEINFRIGKASGHSWHFEFICIRKITWVWYFKLKHTKLKHIECFISGKPSWLSGRVCDKTTSQKLLCKNETKWKEKCFYIRFFVQIAHGNSTIQFTASN